MDSILTTIKKLIGITEDDTTFDTDLIIAINTSFARLMRLGVGPEEGFKISDNATTWDDFLKDDTRIEDVKTFVHLKAKLIFDPPSSSGATNAINEIIKELEWLLMIEKDPPVEKEVIIP